MNYDKDLVHLIDDDMYWVYWRAIERMAHQGESTDRTHWLRNVLMLDYQYEIGECEDDPPTRDEIKYILCAVLMSGISKQEFWHMDERPEDWGMWLWHTRLRRLRNDEEHGKNMFIHFDRRNGLTSRRSYHPSRLRLFTDREIKRFNLEDSKRVLGQTIIASKGIQIG